MDSLSSACARANALCCSVENSTTRAPVEAHAQLWTRTVAEQQRTSHEAGPLLIVRDDICKQNEVFPDPQLELHLGQMDRIENFPLPQTDLSPVQQHREREALTSVAAQSLAACSTRSSMGAHWEARDCELRGLRHGHRSEHDYCLF